MNFHKTVFLLPLALCAAIFATGCNPTEPLGAGDARWAEISAALMDGCNLEGQTQDISVDALVDLKAILDEVYKGELTVQTTDGGLRNIESGYDIGEYPDGSGTAGAIVGWVIPAPIERFAVALTWNDQMEVFTDRYVSYARTYVSGDKDAFVAKSETFLACDNHVVDIGQEGVNFDYYTDMDFKWYTDSELPTKGVIVECNYMPAPAVNVSGAHDAWMSELYSISVYYPQNDNATFRVVASWLKAGGSFWFMNFTANSGNIGDGIVDEMVGIKNFVLDDSHFD